MNKKTVLLLLTLVLAFGVAVGSTMAFLATRTESVVNTFVAGDVDIKLEETGDGEFTIVPGVDIEKDPTITVKADSEKCYVFVKLEESAGFPTFLTYEVEDGWTQLPGNTGVWYQVVEKSNADKEYHVLKGDKVTVSSEVTKEQLATLKNNEPKLTVTGYACQYMKDTTTEFTATEAWAQVANLEAPAGN